MFLVVDVFDINQHQICNFKQFIKLGKEGFLSGKGLKRRVDTGVDPALLGLCEKLYQEIDLKKRFSSAYGNTAFFAPIASISLSEIKDLIGRSHVFRIGIPGVCVVTILTSEFAPFQKNYKSDSGSVYGTEGLY